MSVPLLKLSLFSSSMNRVIPFFIGVGTVSLAYGNVRENLFLQQRAIHAKLSTTSPDNESTRRNEILSTLDVKRRTIFQQIGDEYNHVILDIYQAIAGTRPK